MWKHLKSILILSVLLQPLFLSAQSAIGSVTETQITSCETRLKTCNQSWMLQSADNLKLLNDITLFKKSSIQLSSKAQALQLTLTDLQNKLTEQSKQAEQYKLDLTNIKQDFEDVKKYDQQQISKWRGRCIWVTIGAAVLTTLIIIK